MGLIYIYRAYSLTRSAEMLNLNALCFWFAIRLMEISGQPFTALQLPPMNVTTSPPLTLSLIHISEPTRPY